jgi:hypothetical protein
MHEQRDVVVSLTCTEGNVALNLIESLRNAEAMGVSRAEGLDWQ